MNRTRLNLKIRMKRRNQNSLCRLTISSSQNSSRFFISNILWSLARNSNKQSISNGSLFLRNWKLRLNRWLLRTNSGTIGSKHNSSKRALSLKSSSSRSISLTWASTTSNSSKNHLDYQKHWSRSSLSKSRSLNKRTIKMLRMRYLRWTKTSSNQGMEPNLHKSVHSSIMSKTTSWTICSPTLLLIRLTVKTRHRTLTHLQTTGKSSTKGWTKCSRWISSSSSSSSFWWVRISYLSWTKVRWCNSLRTHSSIPNNSISQPSLELRNRTWTNSRTTISWATSCRPWSCRTPQAIQSPAVLPSSRGSNQVPLGKAI